MARSLSVDSQACRSRAIEGGSSCRAVAQRFGVSASSAIRWRAMKRREGDVRPKRQGGDRHSQRIEAHAELILSAVAAKSDITLAELRERLKERGVAVAIGTLWRFLASQITRKKKSAHAAEQRRSAVNGAREVWFERQLDLDPTRIVFIDETAANTKMARLYGRARRGERCRAAVPHGHWKTTTFTAGLRYDGVAAPMVLDGPMNGEAFLANVEQALVPELRHATL
jgi:transposase